MHSAKSSNNCNNYSPINKDKNELQNTNIWSNVTIVLLGSIKMQKNFYSHNKTKSQFYKNISKF